MELSHSEEINKRKKNIIIKDVIENEVEDKLIVEEIFYCLKADKSKIKNIHRVGRKEDTGEKADNTEDTNVLDHFWYQIKTQTNKSDIRRCKN